MARKPARSTRPDSRLRLPPPPFTPGWDDPIDRTVAQMLTSPDPLQRAIAARLILTAPLRDTVLH